MKTNFFFTTKLTENEHCIVEGMIREECQKQGIKVVYYRKFKHGHIPLYRECKLECEPWRGIKVLEDLKIDYGNYYHSHKENLMLLEEDLASGAGGAWQRFAERSAKY